MRIVILSHERTDYATQRLTDVARARGHRVRIVDALDCSLSVKSGGPALFMGTRPLTKVDAAVPRFGVQHTFYGTAVLRQLEQMGCYTLNGSQAVAIARDKLRCLQLLARHKLGIPKTVFARARESVLPAVDEVGGTPVTIRLLEGGDGLGAIYAGEAETAYAVVETLQFARQNVLVQKALDETEPINVRALVVNGHVIAAVSIRMTRSPRSGRWVASGAAPVELDDVWQRNAVRAAQIVGLGCAAVDMTPSADGPLVVELHAVPDLELFELVTGVDVAGAIVTHVEEHLAFPDLDVSQRLTSSKGFGVAEILVTATSTLVGKRLVDVALWERDVQVLSITRASVTLPNPRGHVEILRGDVLLCYGRFTTMRSLLPDAGREREAAP